MSEAACPFCGKGLDEAFRGLRPERTATGRLSRAALFALGAGGFVSTSACGNISTLAPMYGASPLDCDGGRECLPAYVVADATVGAVADAGEGGVPDAPADAQEGTDAAGTDASCCGEASTVADATPEGASSTDAGDAADDGPCQLVCALYGGPCFCEP